MEKVCSMVTEHEAGETTHEGSARIWRERTLTEEELFHGTDEAGRTGWFLRLNVTGMYPRRIGPYQTQDAARAVVDAVAAEFVMDSLTDILNDLEDGQVCIQEGVPYLTAAASAHVPQE